MPICDDDEWEECAEYYDLEEGGELPELIVAVTKQDIKTIIHLLDKGQDIEVRSHLANDYGATALIWASSIGDNQIVQLLLKYGARIYSTMVSSKTFLCSNQCFLSFLGGCFLALRFICP